VLAGLEYDNQIGKLIRLLLVHEGVLGVVGVVYLAEVLKDAEYHLAVDSCHSESLHESTETVLHMIHRVVLALEVLLETLLASVVLATERLGNDIDKYPSRVQKHFGSYLGRHIVIYLREELVKLCVEALRLVVCCCYQLLDNVVLVFIHLNHLRHRPLDGLVADSC